MNFEKIKTLKLVIFALLCCPTVTVQSKQLLHIGTPKQYSLYPQFDGLHGAISSLAHSFKSVFREQLP